MKTKMNFKFALRAVVGFCLSLPILAQADSGIDSICKQFPTLPICANQPGTTQMQEFSQSGPAGTRNYYLYVPQSIQSSTPAPLVVMLHGCTQTAAVFADATGMNDMADQNGFITLYPEQSSTYNALSCWNWFDPSNLNRSGEIQLISMMVQTTMSKYNIDSKRVFVVGFSSGGAMASEILACYNDIFSGGAVHSGLIYDAAENQSDAFTAMSQGSSTNVGSAAKKAWGCSPKRSSLLPVMVLQGNSDTTVNPINGTQVTQFFLDLNELFNDGTLDNRLNFQVSTSTISGSGKSAKLTTYSTQNYNLIKFIQVNQMNHAWSGGNSAEQYTDSQAPNASQLITNFLLKDQ